MSYYAETKCPECGKEEYHGLGGYGFSSSKEKTTCKRCGTTYKNVDHCISFEEDRDYDTRSIEEITHDNRIQRLLSNMENARDTLNEFREEFGEDTFQQILDALKKNRRR